MDNMDVSGVKSQMKELDGLQPRDEAAGERNSLSAGESSFSVLCTDAGDKFKHVSPGERDTKCLADESEAITSCTSRPLSI